MRALIVEDEPRIAADLDRALKAAGFLVETVADGETAWFRGGTEDYDLIVLDLNLPRLDGLTVLKRWRAEGCETPVLILTARGAWTERVEGIDAGADDYLPKPFRMEELIARARALVRRAGGRGNATQQVGRLTVDLNRMTAAIDGIPVAVTPLELRLVSYLALNRDRIVPPTELLEHLYGDDESRELNAIEAIITRLRRKLGPGVIGTRRGFGYHLEDGAGQAQGRA
ncbi:MULTISPECIES: response regulator transcription factor [Paracoccus]|jgi:DNA-binding response OmpR family regulator|uniref:Two component transcriptional regulator, winged helix family n=1 Tax=Paracoccus denitrificans (strain Pd 1222) TaxID=318586 RepID=A1B2L3_PARDP|nr:MULTISPECIES: response regulator transcription factor [Paracoccus]ABL69757.1 two component transcriptional regulator, winged helix family [Paracoccus denitrificans PD1222]MBB4629463.1 DNA-binding response OmpR family regulator [Paracoccus denitrificans]MCU7430711.1 response regulator transcription factor [Paracoccus denitrificans]QAR25164.1 response regulator transcription factor [Paracoccus denitrificans]UFS64950.1 response regulator transcription factor [Paracoccus denitrificans]